MRSRRKRRGAKQADGYRSRSESLVGGIIRRLGFEYESGKFGYTLQKSYVPDFLRGNRILEVKGYFPPEHRSKMAAVIKANPEVRILMIFTNPNKTITKTSKTTYGEWCTKNGIEWCSLEQFKKEYKKLCK